MKMNRRKFLKSGPVAVSSLLAAPVPGFCGGLSLREPLDQRIGDLVNWIKRGFAGGEINLLSNLPSGKTYGGTDRADLKNLYWLQNCNLFGMYALMPYDPVLAGKIRASYSDWYARLYPELPEKTEHYLAVGELPQHTPPEGRYFRAIVKRAELNGFTVGTETYDPEVTGQIMDADPRTLFKSGAIASSLRGNQKQAMDYFEKALSLWDGRGFRNSRMDKHAAYYTRHISYALIAERILRTRIPDSIRIPMEKRLWACQDTDGGIWTNYLADGSYPHFSKKTNESGPLALLAYPGTGNFQK